MNLFVEKNKIIQVFAGGTDVVVASVIYLCLNQTGEKLMTSNVSHIRCIANLNL